MPNPVVAHINEFDDFNEIMLGWTINEARTLNQKTLPVVISSYGGEVYCLNSMIDMLAESGLEIITIAIGKAFSCGAILLSQGANKRYAAKNATVMIHEVSRMACGTNSDIQSAASELNRLNEKLFGFLDKASNKPKGFYQNLLKENGNSDLFLTPEQCLEYGLITDIGLPMMSELYPDMETEEEDDEEDMTEDKRCMKILMNFNSINNPKIKNVKDFYKNKKNFKLKEELTPMNKEQYLSLTNAYADKGVSVMSYDVFASIPEVGQTAYLGTLKETVAKIAPAVVDNKEVEISAAMAFEKKLTEMEARFAKVTEQLTQANLDRINALESGIKINSKTEAVSKAMYNLTKSPEGSRIPEASRATVEFNLLKADNEVKFAHPSKPELQVTQFDLLVESYAQLPVIQFSTQKSLLENKDPNDINVVIDDFKGTTEDPAKDEIQGMHIVKIAKDYAAKNNIDYNTPEGRKVAMKYAESKVYA